MAAGRNTNRLSVLSGDPFFARETRYSGWPFARWDISIYIFTHLNFKWVKITHICLIWDNTVANIDV